MSFFPFSNINKFILLGSLNSKLLAKINNVLNPTINLQIGDVVRLPFLNTQSKKIETIVKSCITISQQEWNTRETSWDFTQNELIRVGSGAPVDGGRGMVDGKLVNGEWGMVDGEKDGRVTRIEEAVERYKDYWTKKFIRLHRNEEELNARFIEIYGLQEELTPDVLLTDI